MTIPTKDIFDEVTYELGRALEKHPNFHVPHVHDELVCEVPAELADEGLALLRELMVTVPTWSEGMPIGAAGFLCERYRKG